VAAASWAEEPQDPDDPIARLDRQIHTSSTFARLSSDDRRALVEIMRDTRTNLPDYWK
jgi:hypothetical protein